LLIRFVFVAQDSIGSFQLVRMAIIGNGIIGLVQTVAYILSIIFFIMWFRRAYNNLHLMGSQFLTFSEGWAAGAWFVPFMNLVRPFRIMREIWNETQMLGRNPSELFTVEEPDITAWWWGTWLGGNIVSSIHPNGSSMLDPGYDASDSIRIIISFALLIISGLILVRIIRKISAWEDELMIRYNNHEALRQQRAYTEKSQQNPYGQQPPQV
ncbi:MAG TPA: DUF4328 domain-containing protein, partial [Bacteroidia bacterium]|nr:DUF4328 domain-containing protein [Bacteroidia bacterium]